MRLSNFNEGAHRRVWKEGTKGGCGAHLEGLEGGLRVGGGWAFGLGWLDPGKESGWGDKGRTHLEGLAVLEPAMQRAHAPDMLALARLVPSDDRLVVERRLHLEQVRVRRLGC